VEWKSDIEEIGTKVAYNLNDTFKNTLHFYGLARSIAAVRIKLQGPYIDKII
jgi:hypothetical protein